jgi:hypothetical protein
LSNLRGAVSKQPSPDRRRAKVFKELPDKLGPQKTCNQFRDSFFVNYPEFWKTQIRTDGLVVETGFPEWSFLNEFPLIALSFLPYRCSVWCETLSRLSRNPSIWCARCCVWSDRNIVGHGRVCRRDAIVRTISLGRRRNRSCHLYGYLCISPAPVPKSRGI